MPTKLNFLVVGWLWFTVFCAGVLVQGPDIRIATCAVVAAICFATAAILEALGK